MIRPTAKYDLDEQHEAVGLDISVSCVTCVISPGLSEGFATWPAYSEEDLLLLSAVSVVAFHQVPARSVVAFSTADLTCVKRECLGRDRELQLLEDTQAYLRCLAQGVKPGSRLSGAWDRFFRVHTRRIHRTALCCGLSAADAEDCVQDVWLVILDVLRLSGQDPRWDRFSCWMQGMIRNQVAKFVHRMARRPTRGAGLLEDDLLGPDSDPVATCQRSERRRLVRHVLTHLEQQVSATNYQVAHFRWIEQREVAEVAARLDLTPSKSGIASIG